MLIAQATIQGAFPPPPETARAGSKVESRPFTLSPGETFDPAAYGLPDAEVSRLVEGGYARREGDAPSAPFNPFMPQKRTA